MYATIYDEAVAAGTAKGLEQGVAKGVEAGVLRGRVQMLMRLLERRGFELDEARQQQVNGCTDAAVLRDWFDRAVTVATLDEVFGPASVA